MDAGLGVGRWWNPSFFISLQNKNYMPMMKYLFDKMKKKNLWTEPILKLIGIGFVFVINH
jgi:hypothetical protein